MQQTGYLMTLWWIISRTFSLMTVSSMTFSAMILLSDDLPLWCLSSLMTFLFDDSHFWWLSSLMTHLWWLLRCLLSSSNSMTRYLQWLLLLLFDDYHWWIYVMIFFDKYLWQLCKLFYYLRWQIICTANFRRKYTQCILQYIVHTYR